MSCNDNGICNRRRRHLILCLLFLLVSCTTEVRFMAEGRLVSKLNETPLLMEVEEKAIVRNQIGSRPPRCQRRCNACGHCEAVQVPAVPQNKSRTKQYYTVSTKGEDSPNYKPMSWKCRCGNMIFNP